MADVSAAKPDSADGCRSAFSELCTELSIEDCEFCSSEASEQDNRSHFQTLEKLHQMGQVLKIPRAGEFYGWELPELDWTKDWEVSGLPTSQTVTRSQVTSGLSGSPNILPRIPTLPGGRGRATYHMMLPVSGALCWAPSAIMTAIMAVTWLQQGSHVTETSLGPASILLTSEEAGNKGFQE